MNGHHDLLGSQRYDKLYIPYHYDNREREISETLISCFGFGAFFDTIGFMFYILLDKENPRDRIVILRFIGRECGYHQVAGCKFSFDGSDIKLKRQHFFYTDAFKGKRLSEGYNLELSELYVFPFDPDANGQAFHGIGEFPLDQLDTSLFYPSPNTEWEVWD